MLTNLPNDLPPTISIPGERGGAVQESPMQSTTKFELFMQSDKFPLQF